MLVRDTLTNNQIPAFENYFRKTNELHRHNTRHTSKNTVEISQPLTETYGRGSVHFQSASIWNNLQNSLAIDMLTESYSKVKKNLTKYFFESLQH